MSFAFEYIHISTWQNNRLIIAFIFFKAINFCIYETKYYHDIKLNSNILFSILPSPNIFKNYI